MAGSAMPPRMHRGRLKLSGSIALVCVVFLWLITPTPTKLYNPRDHLRVGTPGGAASTTRLEGEPQAQAQFEEDNGEIVNSIIVPSYNEADNMGPLVTRIFQSLPAEAVRHTEVLIVDDNSADATSEVIESLRGEGYNVNLHVRLTERGLSSAVLHGFSLARGSKLLVMDADLQHPPESVPLLLDALVDSEPDTPAASTTSRSDSTSEAPSAPTGPRFALGTRYGKGVEMDKDWPVYRRIISWGARMLSRPLTNAQDPMGGFFALKKDLYLASQPLNPSGFKLGLELLLKTPLTSSELTHVPYGFSKRVSGSSKLGLKVIIKYVGQLLALYYWKFGIFWLAFVGIVVGGAAYAVLEVAERVVQQLGGQDSRWGRVAAGDMKRKRRKHKSDV